MKKLVLTFFVFIFSISVAFATEIPTEIAVLRGLDKVTGRISTFSIPVGKVGQFGKTFIVPEACYTHPPEEFPENSVFLYVFEKSLKGENIELFKGWMFSSEPALSSMEHPVYDVWLIECKKSDEQIKKEQAKQESKSTPTVVSVKQNLPVEKEENPKAARKAADEEFIPTMDTTPILAPSAVQMEEL